MNSAFHRPARTIHGITRPTWLLPEGEAHTDPAPPPAPAPPDPAGGFPADTPVTEMTTEQQAAYWKHQSRKHEERARSREDYDDLKAKAAKLEKLERQSLT